jgi:UDPglucose 6-dehydrogenase
MNVSVVGLGKLGAPMAAVFAAQGHTVTGLDANAAVVAALGAARAPVAEPRLQETLEAGRSRLSATSDYGKLVAASDVTFIIVPTPSDAEGAFSNVYVLDAVRKLGMALRTKPGYHVVVVTSTIMPGSMDAVIKPTLEQAAERHVGPALGLCYNPEFIALGSVIDNMLAPDFILIGESDDKAGSTVAAVYATVCESHPPARRMNFVNAELAKIAVNTFVTTKISYANMLADICDRLPGADVDVVAAAIGSDSRIGRKYLRGAIGYGGPCFPRDNVAFSVAAERLGAHPDIARATDAINRYQIARLCSAVTRRVKPGSRVAILGTSYKPDTTVIEESQGVMLAARLRADGYEIIVHDPAGASAASKLLGAGIASAASAEDALRNCDLAVITTPWPEYADLRHAQLANRVPVLDCWRLLPREGTRSLEVMWLGYGASDTTASVASSVAT